MDLRTSEQPEIGLHLFPVTMGRHGPDYRPLAPRLRATRR